MGMGQALLSRPHSTSTGNKNSGFNLGIDVIVKKQYYGASAFISAKNSILPKYSLNASFSFYSANDTLTEKTDNWYTRNYEIGIGTSKNYGHFFTQKSFNLGHDYFRYLYYDTLKTRRDCEFYKFTPSIQYVAGYHSKSFEMGLSIKAMGYFNWYTKGPEALMRNESKLNYDQYRTVQSNIILEPMLFASLKLQGIYNLRFTARNQMVRNIHQQFPIENKFYYSAGVLISLEDY